MADTLRSIVPTYPVKEYYGDFGELTQNKGKEWADLCDRDNHACTVSDYKRGFNITPKAVQALRRGDAAEPLPRPLREAAGEPAPAGSQLRRDGVAPDLSAERERRMAARRAGRALQRRRVRRPRTARVAARARRRAGDRRPTPSRTPTRPSPIPSRIPRAARRRLGRRARGWPTYDSEPLAGDATMIGQTRVSATVTGAAAGATAQRPAVRPLPERHAGPGRPRRAHAGRRFRNRRARPARERMAVPEGHRIRVEVAQDDDPYVRRADQAAVVAVNAVSLAMPLRENAPGDPGDAGPEVNLRRGRAKRRTVQPDGALTDGRADRVRRIRVLRERRRRLRAGGRTGGRVSAHLHRHVGVTYSFRARAIDRRGVPGPFAENAVQAR